MSAMGRRNLLALFAALPLLKELDANAVGELADEIQWFSVPAGDMELITGRPRRSTLDAAWPRSAQAPVGEHNADPAARRHAEQRRHPDCASGTG
jgi:hypothetical protein